MYGKIIGAMIGAVAGMLLALTPVITILLALLGAVLGHVVLDNQYDASRASGLRSIDELLSDEPPPPRRLPRVIRRPAPPPKPPPPAATVEQEELAKALCPIFIEVARVDGPVVRAEVRAIREFFVHELSFDDAGGEAVRRQLKVSLGAPVQEIEPLVKAARTMLKPQLRLGVVRALYDVALVDSQLQRSEQDLLKRIVEHFNLGDEQLQEITKQFFGGGAKHYETLGIAESASDDDIKSAFRRLAAEHHPDRAGSLGPKEAELAAERFREVKDAYEELKKIRGF